MSFFSGDYFSALRGCCPSKLLHTLEIDQGLLAHTHKGVEGAPKNFNRENLKLGLKFNVLGSITSGLVGVSSWNFLVDVLRGRSDKLGTILEGPPPNI